MNTSCSKKIVLAGGLVISSILAQAEWAVPTINDSSLWWAEQIAEGNVVRDWGSQFDKEWRSQETDFALGSATNWGGRRNASFKDKNGEWDGRGVFLGDTRGQANNDGFLTLRCGWLPTSQQYQITQDGVDYTVSWYSGYFRTKEMVKPGYFYETRFRVPNYGADALENLSHSFWFRDSANGPVEIDVIEHVPNNWNGLMATNIHEMVDGTASYRPWVGTNDSDWHTYGLLWNTDKLQWFFDGELIRSMWKSSSDPLTYTFSDGLVKTGEDAEKIYEITTRAQYLIFDQEALLGEIPGSYANTLDAKYQDMQIDYIARFKTQ